jgi:transposase
MAAREGAVNARRAGLRQLRDLLITTPEPLRSELRPLTRARLLRRLGAARPDRRRDLELRGTLRALQAVARRVQQLTAEERELAGEIEALTRTLAPQLLDQPGVGPLHTLAGSEARPPSPASPAAPRSPPPPDSRSATGSTAAATGD